MAARRVPFMQAARGDKTQIQVPMPGGETKTVELEIPAGAHSQYSAACELCRMSWVVFKHAAPFGVPKLEGQRSAVMWRPRYRLERARLGPRHHDAPAEHTARHNRAQA